MSVLRKKKIKARLHPTKEVGQKRRKLNEKNKYVAIMEIWGKAPVAAKRKNKHENQIEEQPSTKNKRITCWKHEQSNNKENRQHKYKNNK